jgi:hypothetical protein
MTQKSSNGQAVPLGEKTIFQGSLGQEEELQPWQAQQTTGRKFCWKPVPMN